MNAFAEAWVQRVKRECLDHFIVFGETHLRYLLDCWLDYYHHFRPHQGIGNVPPEPAHRPTMAMEDAPIGGVVCHEHLGGLLKHYERLCRARHNRSYADFRIMPTWFVT